MVRILFLDLDGVICCNMHGELERDKLFQVRKICNATNAKVVLSTDWRRRADLRRRAEQTLSALGVECIGATPEYAMYSRVRPKEIVAWMNGCKEPIEGWVAIDDRDLVLEEGAVVRGQNVFSNHFVLTEFHSGLTTALADLAVARLLATPLGELPPSPTALRPPAPSPPRSFPRAPAPSAELSSRPVLHAPRSPDSLPHITSMRELLDEADLLHLEGYLPHVTLLSIHDTLSAPHGGGRVALLAQLRSMGIHKIGERQALANAFSKAQRQGRIGSPPDAELVKQSSSSSYADTDDTQLTQTVERNMRISDSLAYACSPSSAPYEGAEAHLRGFAYAPSTAPTARTPSDGRSAATVSAHAPFVLTAPKEERSVAISAPGSSLRVANGLMSLQPDARIGAIVMHPHPGRGGDMYNAFVGQCVNALRHAGVSTLRFNFSTPDGNGDDMDDLLSANVDELTAALHVFSNAAPEAAMVLIGYSWGAVVALATARKDAARGSGARVAAVSLFAPPIDMVPPSLHPGRGDFARWPMLLCAGDQDEYCAASKLRALAESTATTLVVMPGVDHFLNGGHAEAAAVHALEWIKKLELHQPGTPRF